jgi:transcriptional regulator with AAA-type ATPase domain/NAD-dependent dihydropyrimidine dehydrogenase PreA subunit
MITVRDLSSINILEDFSPGMLARMIPHLTERMAPSGTMILYRGDPGNSMFMILEGTVVVTLRNDEGVEYTLATLEKGDIFGEMALITGEPRTANVKALTDVRLAELYQDVFYELISEYPGLNESLLQLLARRRAKTAIRWQFIHLEREEILSNLFSQESPAIDHLYGKTKWSAEINAAIDRLASSEKNVLVTGERGTGKTLAARLIHFRHSAGRRPLLRLDCSSPPPIQRESKAKRTEEKDPLHLEIAQEAALFGHGPDAGSYAKSIRRGHIELADDGTVILENIESLSFLVQRLLVEYLREGTFVRKGETQHIASRVRLISTSSLSLQELRDQKKLHPDLLPLVGQDVLFMKPLRERKKDIPVIAEYLLREFSQKLGKNISGFSEEALNDMVEYGWPMNINELSQVVERAVAIAEDGIISSSQILLNLTPFSARGRFNLLRIPFLRTLATHPLFPKGLQFLSVPFILGLIFFTLAGPPERNPGNLLVWTVWWPLLILSIIIGARSWCGYCPLPVISDGMNAYRKNFFTVPAWLEKYGVWIGIAGFVLIFLAEHEANMFTSARATGFLLITILSSAVLTHFFLGRRAWCKHICPLGKVVAHFSAISLVELGSNTNICSSQCESHDCVMSKKCPMGLHPAAAASSKDCVLCFSCAKHCRHRSIRLDLRLPWQNSMVPKKWDTAAAFFAVFLIALVLAVKLPSWEPLQAFLSRNLFMHPLLADLLVALIISGTFTALVLLASGFPASSTWEKNFTVSGYAYLFLAFAGFFNVYFHELVYQGNQFLPWTMYLLGLGSIFPSDWLTPNLGTLKALVPLASGIGAATSFFLFGRLSARYDLPIYVRRMQRALILITLALFLMVL